MNRSLSPAFRISLALTAAVVVATLTWSAPAHAVTPGPSSFAPTVTSAAGADTLYIWGSGLNAPSTRVEFYCPIPANFQAQTTSQASVVPFASDVAGAWLAIKTPSSASLGADACLLAVSNNDNSGDKAIVVGAQTSPGVWSPTLQIAAAGRLPALSGASPSTVLAAFNTATPPVVMIQSTADASLSGARAQEILCANNRAGVFPTTNAAATTPGMLSIYPISLPANSGQPNYCAIVVTLATGAYAGRTVLVPGTAPTGTNVALGSLFALEYKPPYTGPIRITVTNTTGMPDSDIYVSVVGDASAGGTASGFAGINLDTLTTQPLTGLTAGGTSTYDKATHSAYFEITNGILSGGIYISRANTMNGSPVSIGSGDPPSPLSSPFQYALAEFTYSQNLYTDLTLIDQIGFSMSSALYQDAAGAVLLPGSNRGTGCLNTLVAGVEQIVPTSAWAIANPDGTGGILRPDNTGRVIGYVGAAKKPALYMTPGIQTYVEYVQTLSPLTISDMHNAAQQPGEFDYTATYANGLWTLDGTIEAGATRGPKLIVESASLYGQGSNGGTGYAMYGEDGPFDVQIPAGAGGYTDLGWGNGLQAAAAGYEDLVKTIYRDFVAGFAYGYWGSKYPRPAVTGVSPGTSTGPLAAYFTLDPRTAAYANAGAAAGTGAWNAYDQLVRLTSTGDGGASGAYGTAYSDTFLSDELSPAIGTNNARMWNIVLGDPPGCAEILPSPQALVLVPDQAVTVLPKGVQPVAGVTNDFVTLTPSGFAGSIRYSITPKLPAGLSFDRATGAISGTPTGASPRTIYAITATDRTSTATAYVTVTVGDYTVKPATQNITGAASTGAASATAAPVAYTLGSAWDAATVKFAVSPALPGSLTMDPTTGLITGRLPASASIAAPYLVSVTDAQGGNATAYVWLTVTGTLIPATQTLAGVLNQPATPTTPFTTSGFGSSQVTYSVVGGNQLPTGLNLNSVTGLISGTPTSLQSSTPVTIQATSTVGTVAFATVNVSVSRAAPPAAAPPPAPPPAPSPTAPPTPIPTPTPTPSCPSGSFWDPTVSACVSPA